MTDEKETTERCGPEVGTHVFIGRWDGSLVRCQCGQMEAAPDGDMYRLREL